MVWACPCEAQGVTDPAADTRVDTKALQTTEPPFPALPRVGLTPMPGFNDDLAYVRVITERVSELSALADQTGDPATRAGLMLASANLILANQLEPACSRRLLHLWIDPDEEDEAEILGALARADELLTQVDTLLQQNSDQGDLAAGWPEETRDRLDTLRAFAAALRVQLLRGQGDEAGRAARRAASRLSPLLEHGNRKVVAAATFWQAVLRSHESDPSRALAVLEPALADPLPESMPYALFARLLRCRLLADPGSPAAALGLLMQLEERCLEWLGSDMERADAVRAVQLVRIQIMRDWHDRLSGPDASKERQWCRDRVKTLIEEAFADPGDTVMRLTPAIPIVAQPPAPNVETPDPAPNGS